MENRIAELKHDLGADGFCLKQFFATEAAFRAVLLLFNLLAELQRAAGLPVYRQSGYSQDSDPRLRRCSRSSWSPSGDSSVGKLGRTQDQNPIARQHLELANSNFAEVGAGLRNLIPNRAKPSFPSPDKEVNQRSTSEFRFTSEELAVERAVDAGSVSTTTERKPD